MLSIATLNLLNDLTFWPERAPLIIAELRRLQPDLVALQEINIPSDNAAWITAQLDGYSLHICPKKGRLGQREGLAILSRLPVETHQTLSMSAQGRVAHWISVDHEGQRWLLANTHLFWSPVDDDLRLHQVRRLLSHLPHHDPTIICGDFNSMPYYRSIKLIKKQFSSAYAAVHGDEPAYTSPTPLKRGPGLRHSARRTALRLIGSILIGRNASWRGTIDYIFVNSRVQVLDCSIAFDQPSPHDSQIYPSDHLGLIANLAIK